MQELEERQACKRRLTAEGAALGGSLQRVMVAGGLHRMTFSSSHPTASQQKKQKRTLSMPVDVMHYF